MPLTERDISYLESLVPTGVVLLPSSEAFRAASEPWSLAADRHPGAVVEPGTEDELARVLKYLTTPDGGGKELDFAIRGSGCGNASAADVVVSMARFRTIEFDAAAETLDVGAGNNWGDVDNWLKENAKDYVVIGSRCPYIGVAGSTLMGGLSWLSHTYGLGSDPANLIDVRLALGDGRVVWAGDADADLLWALRGGGGNFGAATRLRLQARRYGQEMEDDDGDGIWSGLIYYSDPAAALPVISRGVAALAARDDDDVQRLALHVFIVDFRQRALHGGSPEPMLVLLPFDGHGTAHALGPNGFGWALDVPGADASGCGPMSLRDVHELQRGGGLTHGQAQTWLAAALVGGGGNDNGNNSKKEEEEEEEEESRIDDGFIERCWKWYVDLVKDKETRPFALGAFAILEIMQERTMTGAGSAEATAWPHAALGRKNVLQLSIGCAKAKAGEDDEATRADTERRALDILAAAPETITGRKHPPGHYMPNFTLPTHDLPAIFGGNWERLRKVKTKYDPDNRFNKGFAIPPL